MPDLQIDLFPVRHRLRVRYSEIDAQGVVFNAHYLTYFDTAINEAFRGSDIDWIKQANDSGCDVQLVRSVIEYKASIYFDEEIDICLRVANIGRSSITWQMAIFGAREADLRTTGEIVWVYSNLKESRSEPVPEWLKQILESLE